jgi:uncharacterized DUF497 family protein
MEITSNPGKEQSNFKKHGLDFSFAAAVFADPLHLTVFDRVENGEERWHTIGAVGGGFKILLVVHTFPEDDNEERVHVIGLREATAHERKRYEEEGDP